MNLKKASSQAFIIIKWKILLLYLRKSIKVVEYKKDI